jgi:hypothetical protein
MMTDVPPAIPEGKKEATKTYLEQTKLLVTLASAFLFAPAGLIGILKDRTQAGITKAEVSWLVAAEICFIVSVLSGYVALGSLAGSQDSGDFDVYRPATRRSSLIQFVSYVLGLVLFIILAIVVVK